MFARLIALLMSFPLGLILSAEAHAQTQVGGQPAQAQSLQEELRQMRQLMEQMRQLIERQEALIRRLEAEKSESATKPAATTDKAAPENKGASSAAPGADQAKPPDAAGEGASNQSQTSKDSSNQSQTPKDTSKDTSKDNPAFRDGREVRISVGSRRVVQRPDARLDAQSNRLLKRDVMLFA
jgi:TolA-binding protein